MFDCILVPLDGSAAAEAALTMIPSDRARLLAVELDATEEPGALRGSPS